MRCAGLVLAGGRSMRFGSDKKWLSIRGNPLFSYHLQVLKEECIALGLNVGAKASARLRGNKWNHGIYLVEDKYHVAQGPLSGILNGLIWARQLKCQWLMTVAVDAAPLPNRYALAMKQHSGKNGAIAKFDNTSHYTHGIWSVHLIPALQQFLLHNQKTSQFIQQVNLKNVLFKSRLYNINTVKDWKQFKANFRGRI